MFFFLSCLVKIKLDGALLRIGWVPMQWRQNQQQKIMEWYACSLPKMWPRNPEHKRATNAGCNDGLWPYQANNRKYSLWPHNILRRECLWSKNKSSPLNAVSCLEGKNKDIQSDNDTSLSLVLWTLKSIPPQNGNGRIRTHHHRAKVYKCHQMKEWIPPTVAHVLENQSQKTFRKVKNQFHLLVWNMS